MGWETLGKVWDCSLDPQVDTGRVGGHSRRSGTGRGTLGRSGTGRENIK